jgi:hypothetical protein
MISTRVSHGLMSRPYKGTGREGETKDSPEVRKKQTSRPQLCQTIPITLQAKSMNYACNGITMDNSLWSNSPRWTKATKIPRGSSSKPLFM